MANPTVYRIEEAVRHLRTDLWTTKGRDVRARDRVVIRKAAGRDGYRGIVALGEVLTDPELQPDADNPYWVRSPALDDLEERVTVRYELPSGLPLLKWREPDPVLDALSVSRATGGSIFNITPEQWEAVLAAAGGWPASAPEIDRVRNLIEEQAGRRGTQQGLRLNQDVRQAVEMLAIRRAQEHYERHGWTCEDVSAKRPYDLHCTRPDGREQRVEVKGTTGNGSAVLLTPNEVEHARRHQPQAALFVLADVQISGMDGSEPTATGGTAQILEPWLVEDGRLSPLGFSYILRP